MNEELQSTNEELETINDELRERTVEVNRSNGFLEAILASLGLAIAIVDRDHRVMAWNRRAEDLWGVRPDEAVGQHLLTLDLGLPTERLAPVLRGVLAGTADGPVEIELPAVNRRGRAITCSATVMALVDADDGDGGPGGAIVLMRDEPVDGKT